MTLNLKMLATLDASGVKTGARESLRAISSIGDTAENTSTDLGKLSSAATAAAQAARAQGNAFRFSGQQAANSNRLAAHEVNVLAQQLSDGAIQVASGQSLFTAILQQGSQVQFLLGSKGVNSIGGSIALLKQGLIGFLNPINLAVAGLAAGAAGAAALYNAIAADDSATDALEAQGALIEALADRYDEVAAALDRLQDRPSIAGIALDRDELEEQRRLLTSMIGDIETSILRSLRLEANALSALAEPLTDYASSVREFQRELRATAEEFANTETSAESLIARLLELAQTAPDTEAEAAIRTIIREARGADDGLLQLIGRLNEVEASLRGIGLEATALGNIDEAANARIGSTFGIFEEANALDRLRSQLRPRRSESSDLERQREQVERFLATQDQTLERLRLETSLIGESEAARRRAIAALEAEFQIREFGLDLTSKSAEILRDNASAILEETQALENQQEAWAAVQSAGEAALRSITNKLASGDLTGALSALISQVSQLGLQLAAINPLSNSLFGTSYPTLGSVGGLFGGVFGGGSSLTSALGAATLNLYDGGGPTLSGNDTDIAGLVHRNEYVFDAKSTRKIGVNTLEALRQGALRGYQDGGLVTTSAFPAPRLTQTQTARSKPGPVQQTGDTFIMNITTPDIQSFRASRSQLAGEFARMTVRGGRNG
ncbi:MULTISPECIES: phage tail length tape measure family protein [unclassified Roseibium]|uniref:phage tail length tape measure family protein n=1 Tax=unclassified Roseibium TaxID=2629323 RepID=UPI00273FAAD9|nr:MULTISPECIES: phage tail length tape measure family protein [unclassified Roseibium]